ncbi:putative hydrolase or acyltransferase of alpha/beta superfamily [Saccharomonospora marina XMU15]|uniref:Putative hydrolase or acyltransferase of alpha/beta superfamily n=1 Tax=Saccharomonospora marina XMU15 TaxID=882083 RepID=H5X538_9PSEU|nr:acetoin dehydrogenase dihydrolipoyllysine-residue acetyltransferase subunit [Saccharomonospora marina]EHR53370.1 putative hydrolase or acyltransferase of alpha/beta superfamily [Saccharomonospora marina XMU15]
MSESIEKVAMPKWGLSMSTGRITEWLVSEGDQIAKGDDLADIDTDKIAGTLEATNSGVLRRIVAHPGEDVPVGGTIALVAPSEVPEADIEAAATLARQELDSGAVQEVTGPTTAAVEVDGRTLAYAALGEADDGLGEPVVLVHGYGGDKNSWLFVQEPLALRRPVYALDLPGHGESSKDVGDGSLDTLAGAVLGFLSELGVARAHLVGHSLGGAVVTAAAAARQEAVASLTLVAPAGFGARINAGYLRGFATASSRRELKPHLGALFAEPSQVTRKLADDLLRYKRLDGVGRALETLLGTLLDGDAQGIDAAPLLSRVQAPVATVWGREDAVLPVSNAAGLAEVTVVGGAGHLVHLERPGEVVAVIERLLA